MDQGRIVVIGAEGMLGGRVVEACRGRGLELAGAPRRADLDAADAASVRRAFSDLAPDVVVNCAAWTDVDGAESAPVEAMRGNRDVPAALAAACAEQGALLVHVSTDYVFSGEANEPWPVDAPASPLNVYGRTKLAGEDAVRAAGTEHLIVRTSWLFDDRGRNFVTTMLGLGRERDTLDVVDDQVGRPTACDTLAGAMLDLVGRGARGTLHATNGGRCSWFQFARAIMEQAGLDCRVRPCASSRFPRPAPRPRWSVLDLSATESLLGPMEPWESALRRTIDRRQAGAAA